MAQRNTNSNKPTPQPQPETTAQASETAKLDTAKKVNAFEVADAKISDTAREKALLVANAKQRLAEAKDLFAAGDEKAKEGSAIADKASVALYQGRAAGTVSAEEVSAVLRDIFGAKKKNDGSDSKTPDGQGEMLRKRIVRMTQAHEFVVLDDVSAASGFFAGVPDDAVGEIEAVIASVDAGDLSIYSAYDQFAEIKREHTERVNFAFDPKKIAALNEALGKPEAIEKLAASTALFDEYVTLSKMLRVLGEGVTAIREAQSEQVMEEMPAQQAA